MLDQQLRESLEVEGKEREALQAQLQVLQSTQPASTAATVKRSVLVIEAELQTLTQDMQQRQERMNQLRENQMVLITEQTKRIQTVDHGLTHHTAQRTALQRQKTSLQTQLQRLETTKVNKAKLQRRNSEQSLRQSLKRMHDHLRSLGTMSHDFFPTHRSVLQTLLELPVYSNLSEDASAHWIPEHLALCADRLQDLNRLDLVSPLVRLSSEHSVEESMTTEALKNLTLSVEGHQCVAETQSTRCVTCGQPVSVEHSRKRLEELHRLVQTSKGEKERVQSLLTDWKAVVEHSVTALRALEAIQEHQAACDEAEKDLSVVMEQLKQLEEQLTELEQRIQQQTVIKQALGNERTLQQEALATELKAVTTDIQRLTKQEKILRGELQEVRDCRVCAEDSCMDCVL